MPSVNLEWLVIDWYPYVRSLRDNDRHLTYLSKNGDGHELVVKVAKTPESSGILRKEILRIRSERGEYISGPTIVECGDNYFVARKYEKTVGEVVGEMESAGDEDGLRELFTDLVAGTSEISHDEVAPEHIDIAQAEATKRSAKYTLKILKSYVSQRVGGILWAQKEARMMPDIPIMLIMRSFVEFCRYEPVRGAVARNHACLHLDHIFTWDQESGKYVAIDWEHSERQPYRYKYLDETYIFQNLLQKYSEGSAKMFYEEFVNHHWSTLDGEEKSIRMIFIKKLLWWLFEMLEDAANNPEPYEGMRLHLKYLRFFLESADITTMDDSDLCL